MNQRILLTAAAVLACAGACSLQAQGPAPAAPTPAAPPAETAPAPVPAPATVSAPSASPLATTATTTAAANPAEKPKYDNAELRKRLTPEQYHVTRESGTETPFHNAYWNNHKPGIYVDVISGKALFSSLDKFDSGTGWPSFTRPLAKENLAQITDTSLGIDRQEVRSKDSDSHIGHVFDDGPPAAGGLRYCLNSAALRFVPVDKLKEEGYGEFLPTFEKTARTGKK